MSIFLDQKYLTLISNRLPLFKKKSDKTYNCRCVLCGDSLKHRNKARGYFFHYKNDVRYKCHNCDASMMFGSFLKRIDPVVFNQYSFEKYQETHNTTPPPKITEKFEQPKFKSPYERLLDLILDRLDTLGEDNEAVQYCKERKIPENKFKYLYYISNIKDIVQLNNSYKESITGTEPRLVIPFYDNVGELTGVTCRALRDEAYRYITVRVKEDVPLIFQPEEFDISKPIYVVEGPIDSLFLDNAIAAGGSSFEKITNIFPNGAKPVYIYDNQPRNKEVCTLINRMIDHGRDVVIWPQNIHEKDINSMILTGINVRKIIKENTFNGLTAKLKFFEWKRV